MTFSLIIATDACTSAWVKYPFIETIEQISLNKISSACYAQLDQKTDNYFILLTEQECDAFARSMSLYDLPSLVFTALQFKDGSYIVISHDVCRQLNQKLDEKLSNKQELDKAVIKKYLPINKTFLWYKRFVV